MAAVAAAGLLLSLVPVASSSAPEGFTVDTTIGSVGAHPGDGVCAATDGNCSLHAAIQETNALPGANAITLPAGLYRLTIAEFGIVDDSSPYGDLDTTDNLTIMGDGAWATTIDQRTQFSRVLETATGSEVSISGVTIRGGNTVGVGNGPDPDGGGILNAGTMTLDGVAVTANGVGRIGSGGAIASTGTLTVLNSTISGNYAVFDGGGIAGGDVTVVNSTISGNRADFSWGGGISASFLTLENATVTDNEGSGGGNIYSYNGTVTAVNSIIADPESGPDCRLPGPIVSLGHNIDSDGSCGLSGPGDLSGGDPQIMPLAANGGQTLTHALSPTSPAIDAADNVECPDTDQRGAARPVNEKCDIGAFEFGGEAVQPPPTPHRVPPRASISPATTGLRRMTR